MSQNNETAAILVASLPPKNHGGREATTRNTSAVRRLLPYRCPKLILGELNLVLMLKLCGRCHRCRLSSLWKILNLARARWKLSIIGRRNKIGHTSEYFLTSENNCKHFKTLHFWKLPCFLRKKMMTVSRHKLFCTSNEYKKYNRFLFRFLFVYSDVVLRSQPLRSLWNYMARKLVLSTCDVSSCVPLCHWLVLTCRL